MNQFSKKPVVLMLVDGFGISSSWQGNAILSADPHNIVRLWSSYKHAILESPIKNNKNPINQEANHTVIGSGARVPTNSEFVDQEINSNHLSENEVLNDIYGQAIRQNSAVHFIGNLSDEKGLFGNIEHLRSLLKIARAKGIFRVFIHFIVDSSSNGNYSDTLNLLHRVEKILSEIGIGEISSICGQEHIRDNSDSANFNSAFDTIVYGGGKIALDSEQAINLLNKQQNSPDNYSPIVISNNSRTAQISDFDSVIFFNHNNSYLTKLISSLMAGTKSFLKKTNSPKFLCLSSMFDPFIKPQPGLKIILKRSLNNSLPTILSNNSINQLYISESSRIPHISSYFRSDAFSSQYIHETYTPTEKDLSFNLKKIIHETVAAIDKNEFNFIFSEILLLNPFETSTFDNTIKLIKLFDSLLSALEEKILSKDGILLLTSSCGGVEKMIGGESLEKFNPLSLLPLFIISKDTKNEAHISSSFISQLMYDMINNVHSLTDVAPTILDLFDIKTPAEMTGKNLIAKRKDKNEM